MTFEPERGRGLKRIAVVPQRVRWIGSRVSKADLLEAAYHLASVAHDMGCDDEGANVDRLLAELNLHRQSRGAKPLKFP